MPLLMIIIGLTTTTTMIVGFVRLGRVGEGLLTAKVPER
jgi:lipid-binding SYLF domain-containing protein